MTKDHGLESSLRVEIFIAPRRIFYEQKTADDVADDTFPIKRPKSGMHIPNTFDKSSKTIYLTMNKRDNVH